MKTGKIQTRTYMKGRRTFILIAMAALGSAVADAQSLSSGYQAFDTVTSSIIPYVQVVRQLCYALAGCVSIVGITSVYWRMSIEQTSFKKPLVSSVASCLLLISMATALPSFFGIGADGSSGSGSGGAGYLDHNGRFDYDSWANEKVPLSGFEVINGPIRR